MRQKRGRKTVYIPTAEEIIAGCEEIRKSKTELELLKRAGKNLAPFEIPEVHVPPEISAKLNLSRNEE